ncbi:MAG: radical SAM family RiPP maturation amino acid epimerase [Gammaproteobacteria bacterium]|nr:radical SAM family RiPP maturation amino acid epimerase [Gammaproteobacteria bacterium]
MNAVLESEPEGKATNYPEISVAEAKRMLEWWCSSGKFRDLMQRNPQQAAQAFNLGFDPEWLRSLWDEQCAAAVHRGDVIPHPTVPKYRAFFDDKDQWRETVKAECASSNPRIHAWRERQCARSLAESGAYDTVLIHSPVALELTDGCTVGCWFCGVGATKFARAWPYSDENAAVWRRILKALHERIGDAARWGFCYWATDPLDNPDYEKFAGDFADIMGGYPQTTTAQADKHVERLRRFLPIAEAGGCRVNRFSVLTEKQLQRIHAAFTPEEMLNVEVVSQMRDGTVPKALAGAFREKAQGRKGLIEREVAKINRQRVAMPEVDGKPADLAQPATIACVSGFLLNVVSKTVKLISPCAASDRWPLGYIVFDEQTFTDAEDFGRVLDNMIETHMPEEIEPEDVMRFHPDFHYSDETLGFALSTTRNQIRFEREDLASYLMSLGNQVREGNRTVGEIALKACFEHGIPEPTTLATLQHMFQGGGCSWTSKAASKGG